MESIGTELGFCSQTANVWQIVGYILLVFKIVLPIILIVIGVISLGKAVITDDDKEAKKCYTSMIKKFILSIVIFFLPTLVTAAFSLVGDFSELKDDYEVCQKCITHPKSGYCNNKVNSLDYDVDIEVIE